MATTVTLTGTGVPHLSPGRAGAGVFVRHGGVILQFDAGRATSLRLVEAGVGLHELTALFITHVHSDHLVGLPDVVMTRWIQARLHPAGPLPIVAPEGVASTFVQRMLDPYVDDLAVRVEHVGGEVPRLDLTSFAVPARPTEVWRSADGAVRVQAVAVRHEPVPDAVAYRIDTPDGAVVVSGDTRVCTEVEELSRDVDVLVHEAARVRALQPAIAGTDFEHIFSYHADSVAVGEMAARAGVRHLVLTHLIPQPVDAAQAAKFADDVRAGGYAGPVTVGRDLDTITVGS